MIVLGTICNFYMFYQITWPAVIAYDLPYFPRVQLLFSGLLLPLLGFMCGCFSAILLRQKPEDVTAIAIETGVQNTGIAIMLLKVGDEGVYTFHSCCCCISDLFLRHRRRREHSVASSCCLLHPRTTFVWLRDSSFHWEAQTGKSKRP